MKEKVGMHVIATVGNILVDGIIVEDKEQNCLSIASVDADILIPINYCEELEQATDLDLCHRNSTQNYNALRIGKMYHISSIQLML